MIIRKTKTYHIIRIILFALIVYMNIGFVFAQSTFTEFINNNKNKPIDKLLQYGSDFAKSNSKDTALLYYSLVANAIVEVGDFNSKRLICKALNSSAIIYSQRCDFRNAMEYLLRAVELAVELKDDELYSKAYNNIANIHSTYKNYETAKEFYIIALTKCNSELLKSSINVNLGLLATEINDYESAMVYYKKALATMKQQKHEKTSMLMTNVALLYSKRKIYDSCFYFLQNALISAKNLNHEEMEIGALLGFGNYYLETKQLDSASKVVQKCLQLSEKGRYSQMILESLKLLSQVAEKRGNANLSLDYFRKYSSLKDSIFDAAKYADINGLRLLLEISKINKQFQLVSAEQQISQRTIKFQLIIQWLLISAFFITVFVLFFIYYQKKQLNQSYRLLVEKSKETIKPDIDKYKNSGLKKEQHSELKEKILEIMQQPTIFCNSDFSILKLAEMVHSNQTYVSQVINDSFDKNFKSFVNSYRIKEALKMFSNPQYDKFTIETISSLVGFESRETFRTVFKEITGVTPAFYVKSL